MNKTLDELRKEIDNADEQIIQALAKRFAIIHEIGELKKAQQLEPLDEQRWRSVLEDKLQKAKFSNLSQIFIKKLYTLIHEYAIEIEKGKQ